MKHFQRHLILVFTVIVTVSSILSLLFTWLVQEYLLPRFGHSDWLILGYALEEIVLFALAILFFAVIISLFMPRLMLPLKNVSSAAQQIAAGKFDIQVAESRKDSDFVELQHNFNHMAAELQANELLKKDFIANISHQFKTPLSVIQGYAKLLREDEPDSTKREYADMIIGESERLSRLTTNILRLSRLDSRAFTSVHSSFLLDEQIRQAILTLEPRWAEKNITFSLYLPTVRVQLDEELLLQVWANLLDNAIKYSPVGGEITVSAFNLDGCAEIIVTDHGPGFDPRDAQRMFEPFYQGAAAQKLEGSGLGLAIVKRIVDSQGGSIHAEASPGRGASFYVMLPTVNAESSRKQPPSEV